MKNKYSPFICFCRTLITQTSGTVVTSIGVCSPQTLWLLRRWFWLKSPWSLKRQIWLSPHCWRSSSATLEPWPLSTTSLPVPLLRAAAVFSTRDSLAAVDRKSFFKDTAGKGLFSFKVCLVTYFGTVFGTAHHIYWPFFHSKLDGFIGR